MVAEVATARKKAKLRPLRFHDLRHTFGSLAINFGSLGDVQHWMGHADAKTTTCYLHYKSRGDEAAPRAGFPGRRACKRPASPGRSLDLPAHWSLDTGGSSRSRLR